MTSQADALGQFVWMESEENAWSTPLERLLRSVRPGGIVFSQAPPRSADAIAGLLARITMTVGFPPFLVLEEDGRKVGVLGALLPPLPSPRAAARAGLSHVGRLGGLVGAGMNLFGFNTNFAPVLDLLTPSSEAILGPSAFGGNAQDVAGCGEAFLDGLASHGVLACGKHFPGLAGAQPKTGSGWPVVSKTMSELWREDLVPYRLLIGKLPLVLLSHCTYKAYDFDVIRPAALSPGVVEGLLRIKLGYRGLAVADLRRHVSLERSLDSGEAAVQAVLAGCDLLVTAAGGAEMVLFGLRRATEAGRLSTQRVDQSLERGRTTRRWLAPPSGRVRQDAVNQLARRFELFGKECQAEEQQIG